MCLLNKCLQRTPRIWWTETISNFLLYRIVSYQNEDLWERMGREPSKDVFLQKEMVGDRPQSTKPYEQYWQTGSDTESIRKTGSRERSWHLWIREVGAEMRAGGYTWGRLEKMGLKSCKMKTNNLVLMLHLGVKRLWEMAVGAVQARALKMGW